MIVRRFFEPLLAQNSYLIGCGESGQAMVIDPIRDVSIYVNAAGAAQLEIALITETHIHADYLSGSRELAARTGAKLLLSDDGDADWKYGFAHEATLINGGDRLTLGTIVIDVVHTPGHSPEHLTFLITDGAVADAPIAAVTGDFVFVGDVGRPDLLEHAANGGAAMAAGARTLYRSLQAFGGYPDWLQIWPAHGAGSPCGKSISAVPHSTLGYERRFNWAFNVRDEQDFVVQVLAGLPEPPKHFAVMKRCNRDGPDMRGDRAMPPRIDDDQLAVVMGQRSAVIDTRPAGDFATGYVPGTINLPLNDGFVTWAGSLLPYDADIYLLLGDGADVRLPEVVRALALIGLDRIAGYFTESAVRSVARSQRSVIRQLAPHELAAMRGDHVPVVIDVRTDEEWKAGHLPAAIHIPLGQLSERIGDLPRQQPLVVQCATGTRSAIAASVLARGGVLEVSNLVGGYDAWVAAGLPAVEEPHSPKNVSGIH